MKTPIGSTSPGLPDLDAEAEGLYRLPIASFIEARDALAARRRAAGDRDGAARVRALRKPSASAWAVNQLHWWERAALGQFLAAARAGGAS
jgi:hypothetical protein